MNSVKYLKDFNSYTKHELFSVYKNLVKTSRLSTEQLDKYLTYYYFLGIGDKEAEIELSKPDVLKRITDRIKSY